MALEPSDEKVYNSKNKEMLAVWDCWTMEGGEGLLLVRGDGWLLVNKDIPGELGEFNPFDLTP